MTVQIAKQPGHDEDHGSRGFDGRNPTGVFGGKIVNRVIHKFDQAHLRIVLNYPIHKPILKLNVFI